MSSFTDNTGRKWIVAINYASCTRVKDLTGVNLLDMQRIDKTIALLRFDHLAIADIALAVIDQEIKARQLTSESVSACFDGNVLEEAGNAILEGLVNFSPTGRRKLLAKMIQKAKELEAAAIESETRDQPLPTSGDSDSNSQES